MPRSRLGLGENFVRESLLNFKLVSRCLLFFKMTLRQEYRSNLSCYCLKSYKRAESDGIKLKPETKQNAIENVQQEQVSSE